ncbi:MAG TPA: nuclear transport factor 2 family protein [Planctomycetota bacterium]|nr:nuclear transport factor 2 family protein [Planctomycetota bacterium]
MRIIAASTLLALASCSGSVDPATAKVDIEKLIRHYHEAYDRGDDEAVIAMLDPDASISDPPHGFVRGKERCVEHLKKGTARVRDKGLVGKRATLFGPIQVDVDGNIAVATYVALVREDKDQANTIFSRVFRYRGGKWLILTEHFTFEGVR